MPSKLTPGITISCERDCERDHNVSPPGEDGAGDPRTVGDEAEDRKDLKDVYPSQRREQDWRGGRVPCKNSAFPVPAPPPSLLS